MEVQKAVGSLHHWERQASKVLVRIWHSFQNVAAAASPLVRRIFQSTSLEFHHGMGNSRKHRSNLVASVFILHAKFLLMSLADRQVHLSNVLEHAFLPIELHWL